MISPRLFSQKNAIFSRRSEGAGGAGAAALAGGRELELQLRPEAGSWVGAGAAAPAEGLELQLQLLLVEWSCSPQLGAVCGLDHGIVSGGELS